MITAVRQRPYFLTNNTKSLGKKEDEESSQSQHTQNAQNNEPEYQINSNERKTIQQQLVESKAVHQQAVASRDATLKSATVNIAQILKDFRGTTKAIGASPELTDEVNAYLQLVEKQVKKDNPDIKIVRSNLKNASTLLDNYITETLQRPSKVVENWIDALFLQQINYRFNEEEINPNFLVKFPNQQHEDDENGNSQSEDEEEKQEEEEKSINIPQDEKLKSLFIQAKKYCYANNSKRAMELFKEALDRAIEVEDKETESKILYEIGKIYDKNDYLVQALTSYNKSLTVTNDLNVKTKAHYSMAQIYDDVAQFESAINHYMSSISYAGVSENLIAQSTSLTKIGNIYSDEYKKEAFDFLLEADLLSAQTDNTKIKGFISSNIANAYDRFNEPQKALKYYCGAIKEYEDANLPQKVAINYKRAAELMQDYKNPAKAQKLYKKALAKARQTDDVQLMKEIHEALNNKNLKQLT
ncbi:MAG: hypothetical protein PHC64_10635 [Candidatus Gastranaerophilales bacterium]|nr:hypothetical protein [Candidatus Gastranaerophilales bacterium]